jgi:phage terminase large subunit
LTLLAATPDVNAQFPSKLKFLFEPHRYKVLYGGRGGAKSWGVARALLIQASTEPLRVLCAREFQNSINESVHHLLQAQIEALGLQAFYEIQNNAIKGANGSEFVFSGIKNNPTKIKSYEGVDRVWVEEAQSVSKSSWEVLIPTIRKEGSEIWLTFNPELATDETYRRFVIDPPDDAVVAKVNWSDNPWFSKTTLPKERDELKRKDPDAYQNIWEGNCRVALEGAIYARELRQAQEDGRIRSVPYDASKQVHTFWDLGWADNTSVWFAQNVNNELRLIDYYSNNQLPIQHYVGVVQNKGYLYGIDWLPHDARAKEVGSGRSVEEIMLAAGRKVQIVSKLSITDGINAARTVFNRCYFDEQKCADGLQALRHYRYDVDPDTKEFSLKPLHDYSSHAADAFRYFAVSITEDVRPAVGKIKMVSWRV